LGLIILEAGNLILKLGHLNLSEDEQEEEFDNFKRRYPDLLEVVVQML